MGFAGAGLVGVGFAGALRTLRSESTSSWNGSIPVGFMLFRSGLLLGNTDSDRW